MSQLVVTDTSCLIALRQVGHLDLLPQLYDDIVAPHAVIAEFRQRPVWLREVRVDDPEAVRRLLLRGLDWGEAEALVLARTLANVLLLIDERRGRRTAAGFGLRVLGTAGLLTIAKREGLIPAVRPLLDALIQQHDFKLSRTIYEGILREAGEW